MSKIQPSKAEERQEKGESQHHHSKQNVESVRYSHPASNPKGTTPFEGEGLFRSFEDSKSHQIFIPGKCTMVDKEGLSFPRPTSKYAASPSPHSYGGDSFSVPRGAVNSLDPAFQSLELPPPQAGESSSALMVRFSQVDSAQHLHSGVTTPDLIESDPSQLNIDPSGHIKQRDSGSFEVVFSSSPQDGEFAFPGGALPNRASVLVSQKSYHPNLSRGEDHSSIGHSQVRKSKTSQKMGRRREKEDNSKGQLKASTKSSKQGGRQAAGDLGVPSAEVLHTVTSDQDSDSSINEDVIAILKRMRHSTREALPLKKCTLSPHFKSRALESLYKKWAGGPFIRPAFVLATKLVFSVFLAAITIRSSLTLWPEIMLWALLPPIFVGSVVLRFSGALVLLVSTVMDFAWQLSRNTPSHKWKPMRWWKIIGDSNWTFGMLLWMGGLLLLMMEEIKAVDWCSNGTDLIRALEDGVGYTSANSSQLAFFFDMNCTLGKSVCIQSVGTSLVRQLMLVVLLVTIFFGFILPQFESIPVSLTATVGVLGFMVATLVVHSSRASLFNPEVLLASKRAPSLNLMLLLSCTFAALAALALGLSIGGEIARRFEFYLVYLVANEKFTSMMQRDKEKEVQLLKKNAFMANISHEIRTPLQGVIGVLDLFRNSRISSSQLEYVNIASKCVDSIQTIMNDIVDLQRLDAEEMELSMKNFNIVTTFETEMANFFAPAEAVGVELISSLSLKRWKGKNEQDEREREEVLPPAIVCSDERRFTQIIRNLLSNAVKFSKGGTVYAGLSIEFDEEKGEKREGEDQQSGNKSKKMEEKEGSEEVEEHELTEFSSNSLRKVDEAQDGASLNSSRVLVSLTIQDEGPGINPILLPVLFDRYEQHDQRETSEIKGLGLGLSLTGSLCRLMKGHIHVKSSEGKGTQFTVVVPMSIYCHDQSSSDFNLAIDNSPLRYSPLGTPAKAASKKGLLPPEATVDAARSYLAQIITARKEAECLLRNSGDTHASTSDLSSHSATHLPSTTAADEGGEVVPPKGFSFQQGGEKEEEKRQEGASAGEAKKRSSVLDVVSIQVKNQPSRVSSASGARGHLSIALFTDNKFLPNAVEEMAEMVGISALVYPSVYTIYNGKKKSGKLEVIKESATEEGDQKGAVHSSSAREGLDRLKAVLDMHQHENTYLMLDESAEEGCLAELFGDIEMGEDKKRQEGRKLLSNMWDIIAVRRLFSGFQSVVLCCSTSLGFRSLWRGISPERCQLAMKPFRSLTVLKSLNIILRSSLHLAAMEKFDAKVTEVGWKGDGNGESSLDFSDAWYLALKRPILVAAPRSKARRLFDGHNMEDSSDARVVRTLRKMGHDNIEVVHDGASALLLLLSSKEFAVAFVYEDLPAFKPAECHEALAQAGASTVVVKVTTGSAGSIVDDDSRVDIAEVRSMTPLVGSEGGTSTVEKSSLRGEMESIDQNATEEELKQIIVRAVTMVEERESETMGQSSLLEAVMTSNSEGERTRSSVAEVLARVERKRREVARRGSAHTVVGEGEAEEDGGKTGGGRLTPLFENERLPPAPRLPTLHTRSELDEVEQNGLGAPMQVVRSGPSLPLLPPSSSPPSLVEKAKTLGEVQCFLVEDDPITRKLVGKVLRKLGVGKVITAEDGRDAIRQLEKMEMKGQELDVVFMDCQMPHMDGFECTARIRAGEWRFRSVPIIATTAGTDENACHAAGMDGYLRKPVRREELLHTIYHFTPAQPQRSISQQ